MDANKDVGYFDEVPDRLITATDKMIVGKGIRNARGIVGVIDFTKEAYKLK